jgi:thiosulfate/3-mercaptopyruvate sulfurtransferase
MFACNSDVHEVSVMSNRSGQLQRMLACCLAAAVLLCSPYAHALDVPGPLVDTDWLEKNIQQVKILDIRENLESFTESAVLVRKRFTGDLRIRRPGAHIPGAVLVDFLNIRTSRDIDDRRVRYMLPEVSEFEELMKSWGVNDDEAIIIIYPGMSNSDATMATRLYWQIKFFGHENVAILNGGMARWLLEERAATLEDPGIVAGNWAARAINQAIYADSKDVTDAMSSKDVLLVDTRGPGLYLGAYKQPYVRESGHIPGARIFPNELLTSNRPPVLFADPGDIRRLADALGIDPDGEMITYCNSGQWASGSWFVFHELLGNKNARVYDGSMHQWALERRAITQMKME